jgi:uncharacterized protein (TIGR02611 family)
VNRWKAVAQRAVPWKKLSPLVRKIVIGIVGGFVLLAGVAMIFLPGPAFVVIPLGLAILATEFLWARNYLLKVREGIRRVRMRHRRRRRERRQAAASAR